MLQFFFKNRLIEYLQWVLTGTLHICRKDTCRTRHMALIWKLFFSSPEKSLSGIFWWKGKRWKTFHVISKPCHTRPRQAQMWLSCRLVRVDWLTGLRKGKMNPHAWLKRESLISRPTKQPENPNFSFLLLLASSPSRGETVEVPSNPRSRTMGHWTRKHFPLTQAQGWVCQFLVIWGEKAQINSQSSAPKYMTLRQPAA